MNRMFSVLVILWTTAWIPAGSVRAEDGYDLWLRYRLIADERRRRVYLESIQGVAVAGTSPTIAAARSELERGLTGLLGRTFRISDRPDGGATLIAGTPASSPAIAGLRLDNALTTAGREGYVLRTVDFDGRRTIVIAANEDIGVLYGVFHFLRLLQTHQPVDVLAIAEAPRVKRRILNHWDNLNRTVERGYAGFSLWDWHRLPDYLDPRYVDYARANASLGINGAVLTNVNANAVSLTEPYLKKAAALAGVFRPYGIRVYLTARFNAPMEIGGLPTADPLDAQVRAWWKVKAAEIYRIIPDFGGFLVKANSEGQPGPQDYGRTHADGANLLADAVEPYGGIVMWRAFVYDHEVPVDRARQAYEEFKPLDGRFAPNVMIQVKNGPIDFQPREPFHPLFGAMPATPLMMEFQITKEYLGFATHLVYLAPLFEEVLSADTYARGPGSTVARVVDGSLHDYRETGIAGVANIGTDRNWCGSIFGQADWYAFGRLAWNPYLKSAAIGEEWLRMTFSSDERFIRPVLSMMMASREHVVDYMTPLGLHHLMARSHHYGPGPWVSGGERADWTSVYYHKADSMGIGFDRTATGSNAVAQYFDPWPATFGSVETCPEEYLLWFHHLPWHYRTRSGRTLWDEIVHRYYRGAGAVVGMKRTWEQQRGRVDPDRFEQVAAFLEIQAKEARWWRDACVLYFQTFSHRPIPAGLEPPAHSLDYYEKIQSLYVPGI